MRGKKVKKKERDKKVSETRNDGESWRDNE